MNKGLRLAIAGLGAFSLILILLYLQAQGSRQSLLKEYKQMEAVLRKDNTALTEKLSASEEEKKKYEEKIKAIQTELDQYTQEKDEWKRKYELASREKEELLTKLQEMASKTSQQAPAVAPSAAGQERASSSPAVSTNDAYWAGVLKEKTALELELNDLKEKLRVAQARIDELASERSGVDLELKGVNQTKEDLARRLSYNEKLAQMLSEQLVMERNDKKRLSEQLDALRDENFDLRKQIRQSMDSSRLLEKKLGEAINERKVLEGRIMEMDQTFQERMGELMQVKQRVETTRKQIEETGPGEAKSVELPPIVVRPQEKKQTGVSLNGQVIAVNKENNFVIVDLGEDLGVQAGMRLGVYREARLIANIEVVQTRRDISAADIKDKKSGMEIQIGDSVH